MQLVELRGVDLSVYYIVDDRNHVFAVGVKGKGLEWCCM